MRLTLRTMLAYLDGILEPADREEIGRKIEESEFARQLVQRLRDCAHNSRLSAPKVSGKGTGPDPNMVAEYLDNTLAGERVPEFEKLCLDSDVDLAEVAACHQILTMVLGQPADIDLEMKQQMYGVVAHAAPGSAEGKGGKAGHDQPEGVPDDIWVKSRRRRKLEVPDYLRDEPKSSKWKTYAAAAILLLVVAGALIVALGPLDRTHPLARLLGFGAPVENAPVGGEGTTKSAPAEANTGAAAEQNSAAAKQAAAPDNGDHPANGLAAAPATSNAGAEGSIASGKENE